MKRQQMRNILFFMAAASFCDTGAYCQVKQDKENPASKIVPQSPSVAGLSRYGLYPTELCYGLVNISVPVYTIKSKQLELPISLSYHSSGIRVNEVASSVGLGWSLNAGGMISVDVRGGGDTEGPFMSEAEADSILGDTDKNNDSKVYSAFEGALSGMDTQADMYYYSAGGINGRFTYNSKGEMFEIPLSDNRIQKTVIDRSPGFTITGSDATRYFFGGKYTSTTDAGKSVKTAYLLNKIVSSDGCDSIVFDYRAVSRYIVGSPSFSCVKERDMMKTGDNGSYNSVMSSSFTAYNDWEVRTISFPGGEVVFSSDEEREDIGMSRLNGISVYQTDGGTRHRLLNCSLEHGYFLSKDCNGAAQKVPECFRRMSLEKVVFDYSDTDRRTYQFAYNPEPLPCYDYNAQRGKFGAVGEVYCDNYAQDSWGYYNGKTSNRHLLRYSTEMPVSDFLKMTGTSALPDFTVDGHFVQACILSYVKYPTGGYSHFVYEPNDGLGGLRIRSVENYDRNSVMLEKRDYSYSPACDITVNSYMANSSFYRQTYTHYPPQVSGSRMEVGLMEQKEYYRYTSSPSIQQTLYPAPAFYRTVTESVCDSAGNGVVKKYEYDFEPNEILPNMSRAGSLPRYRYKVNDNFWKRGELKALSVYESKNGTRTLRHSERYGYGYYGCRDEVTGLIVTNDRTVLDESVMGTVIDCGYITYRYDWFSTNASTGYKCRTSVTSKDYDGEGNEISSSVESYSYGRIAASANRHCQPTSKTLAVGKGRYTTRYVYPQDIAVKSAGTPDGSAVASMCRANVKIPVEELHYVGESGKGDVLSDGTLYRYRSPNRLWQVYRLYPSVGDSYRGVSEAASAGYDKDGNYRLELEQEYDSCGNVVQQKGRDSMPTSFLWSYGGRYPIAEVKNATVSETGEALAECGTSADRLLRAPASSVDRLRPLGEKMSGAEVSLYDYKPLVGVTCSVSPDGIEYRYGYDGMGRLVRQQKNRRTSNVAEYKESSQTGFVPEMMLASECRRFKDVRLYVTANPFEPQEYTWTVTDASGNTVASGTSATIMFRAKRPDGYRAVCRVKDSTTGTVHTLSKDIAVLPHTPMSVGDIVMSDSAHRVGMQDYAFSVPVSEGSGSYTYKWTVTGQTESFSSSGGYAAAVFSKDGNVTLRCTVTDAETGQSVTRECSFMVQPPLDPAIIRRQGAVSSPVGEMYRPCVTVQPGTGSGKYGYRWTVNDAEGNAVVLNGETTGSPSCVLAKEGMYQVRCILTDQYNGHTVSDEYSVKVLPGFGFRNVKKSQSGTKWAFAATLESPVDMDLSIEYGTTRKCDPKNSDIYFCVGENTFKMSYGTTGSFNKTVHISKGKTNVEISFDVPHDNNQPFETWMKLLSVPGGCYLFDREIKITAL